MLDAPSSTSQDYNNRYPKGEPDRALHQFIEDFHDARHREAISFDLASWEYPYQLLSSAEWLFAQGIPPGEEPLATILALFEQIDYLDVLSEELLEAMGIEA